MRDFQQDIIINFLFSQPGECNKFITACISNDITKETCGSKVVSSLMAIDIKVLVSGGFTPNSITWKRQINKKIITDTGEIIEFENVEQDEPHLLIIVVADVFVKLIKEKQLLNVVQAAQEVLPYQLNTTTLVVYGLKVFCRKHRNTIGIRETEISLTQLQLLADCSTRLHETPDDIALTVTQMSKAIAEEPFKAKQNQKLDQEQLYLTGDIKVSASSDEPASLARLWQTQLISLPKVTYEVAQSITKEYPLPRLLMEAFKASNAPALMLADIPIIRTGPISKARRIGPELSRKIYTLMMSKSPEDIL